MKKGKEFKGNIVEELASFLAQSEGTGWYAGVSGVVPETVYYFQISYAYIEEGGEIKHARGEGKTKSEARQNYIKKIAGKDLIFHPWIKDRKIGYPVPKDLQ
jgi:hypothetical protein